MPEIVPRALETPKPAQASRQGVQASHARPEVGCEGPRPARRRPLPQPRGQHAYGQPRKPQRLRPPRPNPQRRNLRRGLRQEHRAENSKGAQTWRSQAREGSARWPDRCGSQGVCPQARRELKPGVTKKDAEMTPQDMRRKGSWAVRFYGRKKLPPLVDAKGRPTRHALSAHAWGEPVPKTAAAARRIAAKGERLLARYRRIKEGT